jgi:hypothetical protein
MGVSVPRKFSQIISQREKRYTEVGFPKVELSFQAARTAEQDA